MQNVIYIFKNQKLYGYIQGENLFLFNENKDEILANEKWDELFDILPEGIDLKIMLNSYNIQDNKKELFMYLKNPIGDYYFSQNRKYQNEIKLSDELKNSNEILQVLEYDIKIGVLKLYPDPEISAKNNEIQQLSISGYQHKLQVGIFNNEIKESYSNFILKPISKNLPLLALNEHLHTKFMSELDFKTPFNGIIYDKNMRDFHYIIKRFDINEDGSKNPQISLNALMRSNDKYDGTIDQISKFLSTRLDKNESIKFIGYIYANALLYNSDLHKKNISFVVQNGDLKLSPAYDIINLYPLKGYSNNQAHLKITGKNNKILISDFDNIAKNFNIDVDENRENLRRIFQIYQEKYPIYLNQLSQKFDIDLIEQLKRKLTQSYEINLNNTKVKDYPNIVSTPKQSDNSKSILARLGVAYTKKVQSKAIKLPQDNEKSKDRDR